MQYQDPLNKYSSNSQDFEIITVCPGLSLPISPCWPDITSPLDKRVRELLLVPVCEAIRAEKLLILKLPEALAIFQDYASSREQRTDKKTRRADTLLKELSDQISLTSQSWNDYQANRVTIDSYRDRLYVNADSLMLAVTQRRLLSPYAALSESKNYFNGIKREIDSCLRELNIEINSLKDPKVELPSQLLKIQASIRIPLYEFIEIQERVDKIRSFISPLRDRFIEVNIPLVRKCAERKRFQGLDREDLVQYGCQGLIIAVENFDLGRNVKFSTFAFPWINQSILKGIADNYHRGISVPKGLQSYYRTISRKVQEATVTFGITPSPQELSGATGIPISTIQKALAIPKLNISDVAAEEGTKLDESSNLDLFLNSFGAEKASLNEDIELLRGSLLRLPLLVSDLHREAFISSFDLMDLSSEKFSSKKITPQKTHFLNKLTLELVTCSTLVLQRSKQEILKVVQGISPVNLALVLNFKSDSPLSLEKLLELPLFEAEFRRGRSLYSAKKVSKHDLVDKLMTRSRFLINQLGNLVTWHSLSNDQISLALNQLPEQDQELYKLFMSKYFDSISLFCSANQKALKKMGSPTAPSTVGQMITKIGLQIMPLIRRSSLTM